MSEFIFLAHDGASISPYFGQLFDDEPLPKDGWVTLDPNKPGFGVTLNKSNLRRPYNRDQQQKK
jgi:L-rhamnonate dehydratase